MPPSLSAIDAAGGVLAMVILTGGCGNSVPSASGQRCRRYATTVTFGPNASGTGICRWGGDFGPTSYECRIDCTLRVQEYASLRDFIDEPRVPNRFLLSRETISSTCVGPGGSSGYSARSFVYDELGRVVRIEALGRVGYEPVSSPPTRFTAWDSAGRPVAGTDTYWGASREFTIAYDDSARTMEWSYGYSVQQDAFGNTIRRGDSVYTVTQMAEVCE
jgi:hypothetical protein